MEVLICRALAAALRAPCPITKKGPETPAEGTAQ